MPTIPLETVIQEGRKVSHGTIIRNVIRMARFVHAVHTEEKKEGLFVNPANDKRDFSFRDDGTIILDAVATDPIDYDISDAAINGCILEDWAYFFKLAYRYVLRCYQFPAKDRDVDREQWKENPYCDYIDDCFESGNPHKARAFRIVAHILYEQKFIPDIYVWNDAEYDERYYVPLYENLVMTMRDSMCLAPKGRCRCDFCT